MNKVELLAPAGNAECLRAAVINGADAVYLGLSDFSARSKADNFNNEELVNAVNYAHLYGVRVYVALNTLIKTSEVQTALKLAEFAYNSGVDAFIVQDFGLMQRIKELLPSAVIHASTQMGVHNSAGAKVAARLGAERVILSREATLKDIKEIKRAVDIEIEYFVHGALCVAFSGNCYFSSAVSSYGGNRGKCLQLCRKKYTLSDGCNKVTDYRLSPKDLCLAGTIKELVDADVTSLKIEGRMRRPEYTAEAVRVYRGILDGISSGKGLDTASAIVDLKKMFNRGDYCEGYLKEPTPNLIYPYMQGHSGVRVGRVTSVFGNTAEGNVSLSKGDGVKFVRNNMETGTALVSSNGQRTTFKGDVKVGDEIFITSDTALIDKINRRTRKLIFSLNAELRLNAPIMLSADVNGLAVAVRGAVVQMAQNSPVSRERINEILTADDSPEIGFKQVRLVADENIFVPVSAIKALKRELIELIKNVLLKRNERMESSITARTEYGKSYAENSAALHTQNVKIDAKEGTMSGIVLSNSGISPKNDVGYSSTMSDILLENDVFPYIFEGSAVFVQTNNLGVALSANSYGFKSVYNPDYYSLDLIKEYAGISGSGGILNLPNIARSDDLSLLEGIVENSGIKNFIVNNIYGLELCKNKNIILGYFMNMLNDIIDLPKICSPESSVFDADNINLIFGRLPLMTFTHCVKKNYLGGCAKNCGGLDGYTLTDETGSSFGLRRFKTAHCYGQMLNGIPINLIRESRERRLSKVMLDLTGYPPSDALEILRAYADGESLTELVGTRGCFGKQLK